VSVPKRLYNTVAAIVFTATRLTFLEMSFT
jgi:hypothetical protein